MTTRRAEMTFNRLYIPLVQHRVDVSEHGDGALAFGLEASGKVERNGHSVIPTAGRISHHHSVSA